jgi:cell fate regulator YaaT (PSP1 superfamily)
VATPDINEGGVLVAPPAELDAGWGVEPVAATSAPMAPDEQRRTPPPVVIALPSDPDGEEVFRLDDEAVAGVLARYPRGKVTNVAGVKFREAGTIHEFDCGDATYKRGDRVLVDTDRGQVIAFVAVGSRRMSVGEPLRRIARLANANDDLAREKLVDREREAYVYCKQRVKEARMAIKVVRCEFPLTSNGRVLFYFASEDRIDFRDLVRDLGTKLRARVEMRQIGVRDEAKMVGGIGSCGRELCCSTFLPAFVPVSIKMAKDQGLALNPTKVSGQCGRLKCCLVYEQDTYKEMRKGLPKVGKRVETPAGNGKVVELDVLRQRIRVWFDEGGSETFPADVVKKIEPPPQPGRRGSLPVVSDDAEEPDEPAQS